jgi:tripeptide aminopeptidase
VSYPQIVQEFLELVRIPSHSFRERKLTDVVKAKLEHLGLRVEEDNVGSLIGGNSGNLIAVWPGNPKLTPVLFSAHLDRVANPGKIVPKIVAERIVSQGDTILGADDISGVVAILDGIRRVQARGADHGDVEVFFSVAEEVGLKGSKYADLSKLRSRHAYVLDTGGPVGTLIHQAPTQYTFTITITGRASHAGIAPELGLNAINVGVAALSSLPEGRISPNTTANFGIIHGGKATNIVCDQVEIQGEARSHVDSELEAYLEQMQKVFSETCARRGAGLNIDLTHEYSHFDVPLDAPVLNIATQVFQDMGIQSQILAAGSGQDGNNFNAFNIQSVGLSPGYNHIHSEREEQSISELILIGEVVEKLILAYGAL